MVNKNVTKRLILDSGAFTAWSQGVTIELDAYIQFCCEHPDVSYYVNLDVIPGKPRDRKSLTPEAIEKACQQGWENYLRMLEKLPKDKVIPVFHQNDHFKWLNKYLEFGTPYIGISPANDHSTLEKKKWMKQVRPYIFDSAGRPIVKQHGFAVTSYDLMKYWNWYSVDSASWKMCASWGGIYLPHKKRGAFDFSESPIQIQTTPQTPGEKRKRNGHSESLTDAVRARVQEWLDYCGVTMGKHTIVKKEKGYKLNYGRADCWLNKKECILMEVEEEGVTNSFKVRALVNQIFMEQANNVLPVDRIYLAGLPMPYPSELTIINRLLSYEQVGKSPPCKWFLRHCKGMRIQNRSE